MNRGARAAATLAVTLLATAYLVVKVDIDRTADVLGGTDPGFLFASIALFAVTVPAMAWRWQLLLHANGVNDRLSWLTRAYFVSYTAGQVLPTSLGGDAVRVFEAGRRHPGRGAAVAGSVVLERVLGGAATLALAAVGFLLALGRYDVGAYLWVELALVVATILLSVLVFARSARPLLARFRPVVAWTSLERPLRSVYEAMHSYRTRVRLLTWVFAITLIIQAVRVLSIWLAGKAVGIDLSPRPYYVMGPMLFLVLLIPFTINGLAVRESFFVSFLGNLGVHADAAFATGFLFFLVTVVLALPGAFVLASETLRGLARPRQPGLR